MTAPSAAGERPAVAYVLGTYLSFTETFLWGQMRSLIRYRPLVLCTRLANETRFPWDGPRAIAKRLPRPVVRAVRPLHRFSRLDPAWRAAIAEHGAKVLHGQYGPNGLVAAVYARKLGLPLVTSFYGGDVAYLLQPRRHLRTHWHYVLGRRALFETTSLVLALSSAMRDDLVRVGCPASKVRIHPNGIDTSRFRPGDRMPSDGGGLVVVMCGRETEKKGFAFGFRAVRRARDAGADVRVKWLRAPGPLGAELRSLIGELGLGDVVEVLDDNADPAVVMRECDAILCPSVTAADGDQEGVPTVLVEAASTGLPAIATRHAGIPEIVLDGETGFLYPERDVEGLAAGLVRLAKDALLRARFGEAARRLVLCDYDRAKLATRLEAHYDDARRLRAEEQPA